MEDTRRFTYGDFAVTIEWFCNEPPNFDDEDFAGMESASFTGEVTMTTENGDEITGEIEVEWEPEDANDFPATDSISDALDELISESANEN